MKDFGRLFKPRAIAVIGASQDLSTISGQPIAHLKSKNYGGRIFPVNPRYEDVAGLRCYPDLKALPETPDVAVVAVAAKRVPDAMRQIGERGVPFAVILSSGFAEAGEEGKQAQRELAQIARGYGTHVIGPNCQGYMSIAEGIHVGFGTPYGLAYRKGAVSITSQSGAFGNSIVMLANAEGLGFQSYVSTGNESVTSSLDFVEFFLKDERTRVIGSYVEGFQDAHRLVDVGRQALRAGKPVLAWKVGNSEAGAKAAASHTANLGGATALYRAAFRQTGIVEVSDVGDLADCAKALLPGRLPKGNRIVIVTISGGAGIAMADRCTDSGLDLPTLDKKTIEGLRSALPAYASVANPLDVTGSILNDPGMMKSTLDLLAKDPNVDMIGLALAAAGGKLAIDLAQEIVRISDDMKKPVLVAWNADESTNAEAYRILDQAGIPRYQSPVRCARGAGALWQYARARIRQGEIDAEAPLETRKPAIREQLKGRRSDLAEYEAKLVLAAYGISVTRETLAANATEAVRIAHGLGFPVAMKVQSADIPHKTEAGGVRIGVGNEIDVRRAFSEIASSGKKHVPGAKIDGILIQEMVSGAVEVIVGVTNDPLFGPAIMVGLGGIFAEVMRDVSFRLAPITLSEAHEMIRELKAFAVLDGARGKPKADVEALAATLARVSALAMDLKDELAELDINPLFVLPAGQGVKAGDALIKPKRKET